MSANTIIATAAQIASIAATAGQWALTHDGQLVQLFPSRSAARAVKGDLGSTFQVVKVADITIEAAPVAEEDDGSSVHGYADHGFIHCPSCGIHLDNGVGEHDQEVNGKAIKHDKLQYACLGCGEEFGPAIPGKAAPKAKATRAPVVNTSTAERPCKLVWQIADDVNAATPGAKRSVVLAECVRQGVAFYTARTQYQQWLGVQKEMAAREAAAAAK